MVPIPQVRKLRLKEKHLAPGLQVRRSREEIRTHIPSVLGAFAHAIPLPGMPFSTLFSG